MSEFDLEVKFFLFTLKSKECVKLVVLVWASDSVASPAGVFRGDR